MSKHVVAIAVLSALVACAAAAQSETSPEPALAGGAANVSCEVRFTSARHVLRIEALAQTTRAASGEYELLVRKDGPSGTSEILQGGPFETGDDAEVALSASEFGLGPGDRYDATLVLRDDDGVLCRVERRS